VNKIKNFHFKFSKKNKIINKKISGQ